jgi:hypothetical protein
LSHLATDTGLTGHVARAGDTIKLQATKRQPEYLNGRHYLENLEVDGRIILKWNVEEKEVKVLSEFVCHKGRYQGGLNCIEYVDYL